ncbi:M14 family metallopeptidase [Flavobacterium azooxidireducens]|uniref:M14 family metallopeptidase n=1 Tax=Flavobacterium azooxidireducens TaxID=1871076 RepID=A0ABY4KFY5_9FLAO|nr:M14 family metallopeptidase [Flavobacterium azooxidireducens]UPQ78367.1 M14 family metallopeptidase [Flavobacterium azooxidireducens]
MRKKILFFFLFIFGFSQAQNDYFNYEDLSQKLKELASKNKSCSVKSIGKSSGGKDIWLLTLSSSEKAKPALLITAGIDGKHQAGTQIAVKLIEQLLDDANLSKLLEEKTLYFVPSVNPDAISAYFTKLKYEKSGNATKTDDDRDGKIGEDGFEDLNNDGFITQVRIEDVTGSYIESPDDERILVKADPSKNQVGKYNLISEGFDNDKDGKFNEDISEGVNIDKNFTFDHPVFEKGSGVYVASEPETRALLDFLYLNQHIYGVLTFGMHNNLSEAPKFDSKSASSRIVKSWLENDVKAAEHVSKLYTEKAAIKDGPKLPMTKGNFAQTAYYHAGKFSFSTPSWWIDKAEEKKDSTEAKTEKSKKGEKSEVNPEIEFLKWSERNQLNNLFVNWTSIKHPDFPNRKAEVGGFVPYVMNNPPSKFLDESAVKHKLFLVELMNAMPKIETSIPVVEKLDSNLFRITIKVVNKGMLPTYAEIGDKIRFISRMKTEIKLNGNQKMVSGRKYFLRNTLQPDESEEYSWLVSGSGTATITAGCATTGIKEIKVELK